MLELLEPKKGEKILDIGSGSGWTTALLAYIVSGGEKIDLLKRGRVIGIERIKELKEFGEKNVSKYNFIEKGIVSFICADGSKGYKEEAPYDKILVSATSKKLYPSWQEQLKEGGRIVLPMGNSIWLFVKKKKGDGFEFEGQEYPGFVFVPLIES
jgi:protein-L-isoaspartate(D-aspartate) O-methyltransferase